MMRLGSDEKPTAEHRHVGVRVHARRVTWRSSASTAEVSPAVLVEAADEAGPKGPSQDVIAAVVDIERRNPSCQMFNRAIRRQPAPTYLSSDHDPLYRVPQ